MVVFLALCTSIAHADKLDDFKSAVTQSGCDSIPYGDLKRLCGSQQSDVHPWCDGDRGPVSCNANGTRDLQTQIEREQRNVDSLKDKRREAEDRRSKATDDSERSRVSSELEAIGRDTEASQKRLDGLRDDLSKRKDYVDKAIYTINKCIDTRTAVMNIFKYASDKVVGESESSLKPYAQQLRDKYPASISGHVEAIENKKNSLENCKKERP